MGTRHLDILFHPASVALAGGSERPGSAGRALLANLTGHGFPGRIDVVHPRLAALLGVPAVPRLADLPARPDLLVITAPPAAVAGLVGEAAALRVPAVLVASAGLPPGAEAAMSRALAGSDTRIVGPNSVGVIAPHAKLNASFSARHPAAGDLAVIAQSGAIMAGLIEWAARAGAGFSGLVALGDRFDADTADLLDHFALDRATRAIVLYLESLHHTQKFMSAARAAARAKPVFVLKAGRHAAPAPGETLAAAMADPDGVFEAAFRRAGLLRVGDVDDLFAVARTLARVRPFQGDRLAILSNGRATGFLAADALRRRDGRLATLSPETLAALRGQGIAGGNPADLRGDADGARYGATLDRLIADPGVDAVLALYTPSAFSDSAAVAGEVAAAARRQAHAGYAAKPVFAGWIGASHAVREVLEAARVPVFETEREAVRGFRDMVRSAHAREALMDTPPSLPRDFRPDVAAARRILEAALAAGDKALGPEAAQALLAAYAIEMLPAGHALPPLFAGLADDPTFGPVVVFGRGGPMARLNPDRALALPPLDLARAAGMIADTRIALELALDPVLAEQARAALALLLVKLAQMAADLPEIREVELHPLALAAAGAGPVWARIAIAPVVRPARSGGNPRLAVRPYPSEWERSLSLGNGRAVFVRPVRPEDEPLFEAFFRRVSPEDLRLRFFSPVQHFSHAFIARLTQLDYARAMAFTALDAVTGEMMGAVRLHGDANQDRAEYAILLRSDLKGLGLGWLLMRMMIDYARSEGYSMVEGQVLRENRTMLAICAELGFAATADPDDPEIRHVRLPIDAAAAIAGRRG